MSTEHAPTMVERWVLREMPVLPEFATASQIASRLPSLSRSTIDKTLRSLRSSVFVAVNGSGGRMYARYPEGSLL